MPLNDWMAQAKEFEAVDKAVLDDIRSAEIQVMVSDCCGDLAYEGRCSFCGERCAEVEKDLADYVRQTRQDGSPPHYPDLDGNVEAERLFERLMTARYADFVAAGRN